MAAPFGLSDEQWRYLNDPYIGMPEFPNYRSVYDPNTMAMAPGLQGELNGIAPDPRGLNQFRKEALRTGPSPWADLATAKSYNDEAMATDKLGLQAGSNAATGRSNLAMRGGLRSGAAERVETAANRDFLSGAQEIGAQGMTNRNQIGINDEQNRITQLGMLPGMENDQAGFGLKKLGMLQDARSNDMSNLLKENQNFNEYNMGRYKTQGEIWGSGKQADATARAGDGGSWICTESAKQARRRYFKADLRALKTLRNYALRRHNVGARFYLYHCHELVRRMLIATDVDWTAVHAFVREIIKMVKEEKLSEAFVAYVKYTRDLIAKYWPDCQSPVYLQIRKVA